MFDSAPYRFNVKALSEFFKLFSVICGAVIGAGFLSGGELVAFFYSRDVFCVFVAAVTFFVGFTAAGTQTRKGMRVAFLVTDAIFAAAMLSGLDDILSSAGVAEGVPLGSVCAIVLFHFLLSENIGWVERINCFLMPVSLLIVIVALFTVKTPVIALAKGGLKGLINALLYACMNVFAALPAVKMASEGKGRKIRIVSSAAFAAFFFCLAYFILRVAPPTALPLFDISRGTNVFPLLTVATFAGSFTSLVCYLYPLKSAIGKITEKKARAAYLFLLYAGLFALSRIGFNAIIKYLYPLIGGIGAFSVCKNLSGIKRRAKGDTKIKRSALCQERKRIKSKNLPKKNTAII